MIAARHDPSPSSPAIAGRADAHISKVCWPAVLLENYRSVQALQACMLLASWRPSGSRGDEDDGWALFGHAGQLLALPRLSSLRRLIVPLHSTNGGRDRLTATFEEAPRRDERNWRTPCARCPTSVVNPRFSRRLLERSDWSPSTSFARTAAVRMATESDYHSRGSLNRRSDRVQALAQGASLADCRCA